MEQVLLNLVSNARDALPNGGHIRIELDRAGPTVAQEFGRRSSLVAEWLVLSVTDDGIGMPEQIRARIFEPFFTTKGPDKGTGLGLATVYGIVKQSGGEVDVTSAEGKGTTIRVLLPAADQADLASEGGPSIAPDPGVTATLVLVDDENAIRTMTTRILKRAGYHVLDAGSPSEALAIAARMKEPIDLLVTDVRMPDLSGPLLAERFITVHPETQVLYMSGYSASVSGVPTDDADHFLQKPFTPEDLIAKIRGLLKRPRPRSSSP
jgi:CheY-like chemotaxis protein